MNVYDHVVRELAESDPVVDVGGIEDNEYICTFCSAEATTPTSTWEERISESHFVIHHTLDHDSDCLWLRAKQAVERDGTNDERTLHVSVNSFGDWMLEKDGERL
jgi:hypothetical protein